MISFGPSEEQQVAREAMREFAEGVMRPIARACDEDASIPDDFLQSAWELGLTSTQIPEAYGGGGEERSPLTNVLVLEELGFGDAALALAAVAPSLFALPVLDHGSDAQRERYLPLFTTERYHTGSLAVCEPSPLFDAWSPRTTAEPKGGDAFVLSGRKCFVPLADRASHFLVLARAGNGGGHELAAFVVPRDAEGLTVSAEPEKNLGMRGLATHSLELERVEVPAADRLGGASGCDVAALLDDTRTALGAVLVGLSRAVLEYAAPYAKDRVAFGEAIAQKQAIAFRLADMRIETDAMRWLVWKAASRLEKGLGATREAQHAAMYAAREAMKIADGGVQVLGGHGFIREHPVEMWYRSARTLGVLEGVAAC